MRLKAVQKQEIHNAYDLAIVIIDQCSQVFFDRTAVHSLRPQVLEVFAHAIGDVVRNISLSNYFHMLICPLVIQANYFLQSLPRIHPPLFRRLQSPNPKEDRHKTSKSHRHKY